VLSGEGADEAFAGYPKYSLASVPAAFRWPIRTIGPERVARLAANVGMNGRRALVAARALAMPSELDRLTQWFSYFDRADLTALFPGLAWTDDAWSATVADQQVALARAAALTPIGRMQVVDCLSWLPGNMLERGDRMTMSEGLELRPPFLDKQLVAFGLALPDRMKVRGKWTKWIVRQWGAHELPPSIHRRPKWGFRVPLAKWFKGELREMLFDSVGDANGVCGTYGDRREILKLLTQHDSGAADHNLALWGLLSVETWHQGIRKSNRLAPPTSYRPAQATLVPAAVA
jgi:asparagine synthase (glutamine-hydrolysing)